MTVCFVGHSSRSSGIIRGRQLSDRLAGSCFVDATDLRGLSQVRDRVCLIVRQQEPSVARLLKNNGCVVGCDLLDRPVSDYHAQFARGTVEGDVDWSRYEDPNVDFFVVNNSAARDRLSRHTQKRIAVIPHHSANLERWKNEVKERVERVAYIGLPDQITRPNDIGRICRARGAEWVSADPRTREELVALLRTVDVGVVFVEPREILPYTMTYKPNTKLTNFQSFGIPTVAVPYRSFEEFGGAAWKRVNSFDALASELDELMTDVDRRRELSEQGYRHAERFHLDNLLPAYAVLGSRA